MKRKIYKVIAALCCAVLLTPAVALRAESVVQPPVSKVIVGAPTELQLQMDKDDQTYTYLDQVSVTATLQAKKDTFGDDMGNIVLSAKNGDELGKAPVQDGVATVSFDTKQLIKEGKFQDHFVICAKWDKDQSVANEITMTLKKKKIKAFDPTSVTTLEVPFGTVWDVVQQRLLSDLQELKVTFEDGDEAGTVPIINWSGKDYNGKVKGEYAVTPIISDCYEY